ncbi:MAG: hypothetical protein LBV18_05305 [Alistipes sp.]|nr:hypothetical protein [Alistipes sp.]
MKTNTEKKICFVISPIGDADSETRSRSDMVLEYIITPPVESMGYDPIRADKISEPGIITTQIIQKIIDSPLVIADLTEHNPNVFYELALRHATKKPLIQLIKKGESIPFDVASTRIISFDIKDLKSVDQAKKEIENQIRAIEAGGGETENPISVSLDLKMLKESNNPEQRSIADVIEALTELRGTVMSIDKRINNPDSLFPTDFFDRFYYRKEKMIRPDFMMYSRDIRSELRVIHDQLQSHWNTFPSANTKKAEYVWEIILRVRKVNDLFDKIYMTALE